MGRVRDGLEEAIASASHLSAMDAAAIEGARALADKIDAWDQIVEWAREDAGDDGRPAVPVHDNISPGSFLKYLIELGLTPAARHVLDEKKGAGGGKLAQLRSVEGARAKASGKRTA